MEVMKEGKVAVILLNWNGWEHTSKCINSLKSSETKNLEIIVIDNASQPNEVALLEELEGIHLIKNKENAGFAGGNNIGLAYAYKAGFSYFLLLNNDTTVEKGFLKPLLKAFEADVVGAVQPKIYTMRDPEVIWNAGGKFVKRYAKSISIGHGQKDRGQYNESREVDWITGCALMLSREAYEQVGYLDEQFFIMSEDVDWSIRARKQGFKLIYVPESSIFHFEGATVKLKEKTREGTRSPRRIYFNRRNKLFVMRKHVRGFSYYTALLYQISACFIYLSFFLIKRRPQKLRVTWKALQEGLTTPLLDDKRPVL